MPTKLSEIVEFQGDRLFNGAVDISWIRTDAKKADLAGESFIFHGPKYHGVQQEDVGDSHGHTLIDTASFTLSILNRCYGFEEVPFTLAIAGYGTGKSHLGLTLARLLGDPASKTANNIISSIEKADTKIGKEIRILQENSQPCLVVTLNGVQAFDLGAEITKQLVQALKQNGLDTSAIDDMRPRFGQAKSLINMSNDTVIRELLKTTGTKSSEALIQRLDEQSEHTYAEVHEFFASRGMPIRVLSAETVREVIDIAVREYCGSDKPYRSLLIIFDEFGKYIEFATTKSQIAGNSALQDLFEAIQANSMNACFVGFIQFELNAYVNRIAPEYKNEILRYITRYQTADRLYLSTNLETIIASLIDKRNEKLLDDSFNGEAIKEESKRISIKLAHWFPSAMNYRIWSDSDLFHKVIRKGCWPLSPFSTWLLFFLTAAGKHLQNRSGLALLADVFKKYNSSDITNVIDWSLSPADLWSDLLKEDLITSEEGGQQGSIVHAYSSVTAKHGARFSEIEHKILIAIVLASKLGLVAQNKKEAIEAIKSLSGLSEMEIEEGVRQLQEEYNVIEWDESFKAFDILGDAVPRTQFLAFLRQVISRRFDEAEKSKLFISRAAEWCAILSDIDCDFAEENNITTREWQFKGILSDMNYIAQNIKIAIDEWRTEFDVDALKGTIIYLYVGPNSTLKTAEMEVRRLLKNAAQENKVTDLPVIVVFLNDIEGKLGHALAELAVLEDMSDSDLAKFGNLVGAQKVKAIKTVNDLIESMVKQRCYASTLNSDNEERRLSQLGKELFSTIYSTPINFPFDGFSTTHGNAAESCHELTLELLYGKLDYERILAKPAKVKNRALTVLHKEWGIFTRDGIISRRPSNKILKIITEEWDSTLERDKKLNVRSMLEQICLPPYGANIASAGLLLGAFISPRSEKLAIYQSGQQIAISKWIDNGIFKGRFIQLSRLHDVALVQVGEPSPEWEALLDEWEATQCYEEQIEYKHQAVHLEIRIPLPHKWVYRKERLEAQSDEALVELDNYERTIEDACDKIEKGTRNDDVAQITWGVANLNKLLEKMHLKEECWTHEQIDNVQSFYERERTTISQLFDEWLIRQNPKTPSPEEIGNFKHKMIHLIGNNLKIVQLSELFQKLEKYTIDVVSHAEEIVNARQLKQYIQDWIKMHRDEVNRKQISQLRNLRKHGTEYLEDIKNINPKIKKTYLDDAQLQLEKFIENLQSVEKEIKQRASAIWNTKIGTIADLENTALEVEELISSYSDLPADLDDFKNMREALRLYKLHYTRLIDESLNWPTFKKRLAEMKKECKDKFGDDEVPWPLNEVIHQFEITISEQRRRQSANWLGEIRLRSVDIPNMSAVEANQLQNQVNSPPAVLTDEDGEILNEIAKTLSDRLNELNIEWLIERFKALPEKSRVEFAAKIKQILIN